MAYRIWRRLQTVLLFVLRRFLRSPRRFFEELERYASNLATNATPVNTRTFVPDTMPNVLPINLHVGSSRAIKPHLNVMIPGMQIRHMSGGPNVAINLTLRLAREGIPVRYISTDVEKDDEEALWKHFQSLTGISERFSHVEIASAHDRSVATVIDERDVFLATAWSTAQMIKYATHRMKAREFIYLIQDFEPGFYRWSALHALALETYSMDFKAVIHESLLKEYLIQNRIGRFADPGFASHCLVFEPAVDRTRFHPNLENAGNRRKRLLFYARPTIAPRNMYELGIVALKRAAERGAFPADEWDLRLIGERLPSADLGNGIIVHSTTWLDYDKYAALLRESDIGLSLMLSPHTGFPPLEMACCGMNVVTNTFSVKTADRLRAISGNIVPVAPTLDSIVEGLIEASTRSKNIDARIANSTSSLPSNWDDVLDPLVPKVREMMEDCMH